MTTPPEVLAAMCHALARHEGIYPLSAKRDTTHLNYHGHVEAALAAAEALGWRLVPVEPTEEMGAAHFEAHARADTVFASVPEVWAAMLDAAPKVTSAGAMQPASDHQR